MNTYCTYIYSYKYTNPFAYKQLLNIPFFLRNIPAKIQGHWAEGRERGWCAGTTPTASKTGEGELAMVFIKNLKSNCH